MFYDYCNIYVLTGQLKIVWVVKGINTCINTWFENQKKAKPFCFVFANFPYTYSFHFEDEDRS